MDLYQNEYFCSCLTSSPDLDWITANQFCCYEQPALSTSELMTEVRKFFAGLFKS